MESKPKETRKTRVSKSEIEEIEKLNQQISNMDEKQLESKGLFNPIKGAYEEIVSDFFTLPDGLLLDDNLYKEVRLAASRY